MAQVKPFSALRYHIDAPWETLCCPPYDIIPAEAQSELEARNPYNVIRLERPLGENSYQDAAALLSKWQRQGVLQVDDKPAYYLYELAFTQNGQPLKLSGLMARVTVEPFSSKVVLPHEETLSKAKADRFNLMCETFCNFSQVYCLYEDPSGIIRELCDRTRQTAPEVAFTMPDGVGQRLWLITAEDEVAAIRTAFAGRQLFIADGHHRYETALKFRDHVRTHVQGLTDEERESAGDLLMMLVDIDHPGLVVHPTHRLVRNKPEFDAGMTLAGLTGLFDIERRADFDNVEHLLESTPHSLVFYHGGDDYCLLRLRDKNAVKSTLPDQSDAYCGLAVTLLHTMVLEPVFGIDKENMASGRNLAYTRDIGEALREVREGDAACAFLLPPTRVTEIRDVSLAGEKMPQKSTYFYPKLVCGLVINKIMDIPEQSRRKE